MAFTDSKQKDGHALVRVLDVIAHVLLLVGTFLFPLFYLPFTTDVINLPKTLLLYSVTLIVVFLWLLRSSLSKHLLIRRTVFDTSLGVFAIVLLVSSVVSLIPSISFLGKNSDFVVHTAAMISMMLWLYALVQYIGRSDMWRRFVHTILLSGFVAGLIFIFRTTEFVAPIAKEVGFNTVSSSNSVFAIYMAIVGVISIGLVAVKGRTLLSQGIPVLSGIVSIIALLQAGFTIGWIIFAVGVALVLVMGISMIGQTSVPALSVAFFLFLITILLIFFGTPAGLKTQLPVEVALGAQPSWDIAKDAFLHNTKSFMLGSGPGTFTQDFSMYRTASFNASEVAWAVRFEHPYNVFFGILAETGILGALSFVFLVLLAIGSMLSAWLKTRPSALTRKQFQEDHEDDPIMLEVFVLVSALIASTVGMAIAFYDIALWWMWWSLLALTLIGLSAYVPSFIREQKYSLKVSPQYTLVTSFSMILFLTAIIVVGIFGGRMYWAEMEYEKATTSGNNAVVLEHLKRASELRPAYAPYLVALAQSHLEQAKIESKKATPKSEIIVASLGEAINTARAAADSWDNDVETWQTLAVMYQNAEGFAPEALQWSIDAFEEAIKLEPTNPLLHWRKGQVLLHAENIEAAKEELAEAIRLKPDYIPAYVDLSTVFEQEGDITTAIEIYEPIFTRIANNPDILFNLGRLFYNRNEEGDNDRAEQVWLRSVELLPDYSNALYSLGLLYERKGQKTKAVEYFNKTQELNPNNTDIRTKVEALLAPVTPPPAAPEPESTQ